MGVGFGRRGFAVVYECLGAIAETAAGHPAVCVKDRGHGQRR